MLIGPDRQGETESASFPFATALHPDAPMVRFYQSLSDALAEIAVAAENENFTAQVRPLLR